MVTRGHEGHPATFQPHQVQKKRGNIGLMIFIGLVLSGLLVWGIVALIQSQQNPNPANDNPNPTNDKCQDLREQHPSWYEPNAVRWSTLDLQALGVLDENMQLTSMATEQSLYDIGYLWMCSLSTAKENSRELHSAEWVYGNDGNLFLGSADQEIDKYTTLAKAFNRGYVNAQEDRNVPST